jgi:hypothetical protein
MGGLLAAERQRAAPAPPAPVRRAPPATRLPPGPRPLADELAHVVGGRPATPPGPSAGVLTLDVRVTVSRQRQTSVEVLGSVGVDSQAWGKLVQDAVHPKVGGSPLFPWPTGTKPLAQLGVAGHQPLDRLVTGDFRGLRYSGRLEIDESAVAGTRRTEGSLRARFVVRTAELRTPLGPIWLEFSPAGELARGLIRYHDGRVATLEGLEPGASSSITVNLGPVGLGLAGELLTGTDPAFQAEPGQAVAVAPGSSSRSR